MGAETLQYHVLNVVDWSLWFQKIRMIDFPFPNICLDVQVYAVVFPIIPNNMFVIIPLPDRSDAQFMLDAVGNGCLIGSNDGWYGSLDRFAKFLPRRVGA